MVENKKHKRKTSWDINRWDKKIWKKVLRVTKIAFYKFQIYAQQNAYSLIKRKNQSKKVPDLCAGDAEEMRVWSPRDLERFR